MPTFRRTTPCWDCPFKRNAAAGWLGNDNPVDFIQKTEMSDGDMPCHTEIDYTDPEWRTTQEPNASYCAGGMQYLNNTMKTPRAPKVRERVESVGTNPKVFDWPWEFLAYHMMREVSVEESQRMMSESRNKIVKDGMAVRCTGDDNCPVCG